MGLANVGSALPPGVTAIYVQLLLLPIYFFRSGSDERFYNFFSKFRVVKCSWTNSIGNKSRSTQVCVWVKGGVKEWRCIAKGEGFCGSECGLMLKVVWRVEGAKRVPDFASSMEVRRRDEGEVNVCTEGVNSERCESEDKVGLNVA